MLGIPINIGFGNLVLSNRIVAIVSPDSAPVKRLIRDLRDTKSLIDATQGRRTRAVIFTDSEQIILSAIQPETIGNRISSKYTGEIDFKEDYEDE